MSDIQAVELKAVNVEYVLAHPWEVSRDELSVAVGEENSWRGAVDRLWLNSKYAVALECGDGTVAIIGGCLKNDGVWSTWFIASDLFLHHAKAATKATRLYLKQAFAELKPVRIVSITASARKDAANWFKLIGFARAPEYDYYARGRAFRGFMLEG